MRKIIRHQVVHQVRVRMLHLQRLPHHLAKLDCHRQHLCRQWRLTRLLSTGARKDIDARMKDTGAQAGTAAMATGVVTRQSTAHDAAAVVAGVADLVASAG